MLHNICRIHFFCVVSLRICKKNTTFVANMRGLLSNLLMARLDYIVAGHRFAVESCKSEWLSMMTNYEPFKVGCADVDAGEPVFVLRLDQQELLDEVKTGGYQLVFTDNSEADMPRIEVWRDNEAGGWLLRVSELPELPICCELECDASFTHGSLRMVHECRDVRFCIDNALMLLYAFRTAPLRTLEMHAAVVVKRERVAVRCQTATESLLDRPSGLIDQQELGYLFLGHSGTGKSTHARQWLAAFDDAWLLNDDNPILRVMEDGEVRVYGSPWSGKTPCYVSAHARVGGIVKLSQAPHNHLHPLSLPHAYAYIFSSASGLKIDKQMADCLYDTIKHVVTHAMCYHMECLPNTAAAEVCWEGMKGV